MSVAEGEAPTSTVEETAAAAGTAASAATAPAGSAPAGSAPAAPSESVAAAGEGTASTAAAGTAGGASATAVSESAARMAETEREAASGAPNAKKSKVELQSLTTRAYLDQTVVPILLQGLSALSKERPANPIEFLSAYLIKNKDQFGQN